MATSTNIHMFSYFLEYGLSAIDTIRTTGKRLISPKECAITHISEKRIGNNAHTSP